MVLHPAKTKFIIFSKNRNLPDPLIHFVNDDDGPATATLQRINRGDDEPAAKFLGVYFDCDLSFNFHITTISKKLSKALYLLRSAKHIIPENCLKTLYFSTFHCHLIYAIQIWSCCQSSLVNKLFKQQKNAIRILSGAAYNAHTEPLFKAHEILPLPDLISFFKLQFMHRYVNSLLPISFNDTWKKNTDRNIGENRLQLRNEFNFQHLVSKTVSLDKLPLFQYPRLWDQFPDLRIKCLERPNLFDRTLKKFFIDDLSDTPNCERLFCPACSKA